MQSPRSLAPGLAIVLTLSTACALAQAPKSTLEPPARPGLQKALIDDAGPDIRDDPRYGRMRLLSDHYHPWTPAATKDAWEKQARSIRERVLVATGLWPMPPKEPLQPVIHGKIDRGDYTVEKVFFASLPGHYVTGNLYRPAKIVGKVPGVLCPHGHWANGRLYDAGEKEAQKQLEQKAESHHSGARFPLQARMVGLARTGCVVFHYDMVGYADNKPLSHQGGLTDAEAELRLQSECGLQTFNSIRALDFLQSLPEVDPQRIGVTGASGGGTQTFLLGAVDPRPAVAFPAVMVGTNMQGGCVCENADLLRVGINNVAIAALFAPKPLAMSGAHDWTIDIETKGLPELKHVYGLYGESDNVFAKCFPQFGHNYNQVSRELMYNWFNAHLGLERPAPIVEADFQPIEPEQLHVFDAEHPRPTDAKDAAELRQYLTGVADKQFAELVPKDASGLPHYREVVGMAARVMLNAEPPNSADWRENLLHTTRLDDGTELLKGRAVRSDDKTQLPWILLRPQAFRGTAVFWFDGQGKSHLLGPDGKPSEAVRKLLRAGEAVASADLFLTGEFAESHPPAKAPKVIEKYAAFTFAYNPTVVSSRVHDIVTAVGLATNHEARKIRLVGTGEAGPCVLLAAGLLHDRISDVLADAHGLSYRKIPPATDLMFLPGALKYGGLGGLAALAAPTRLEVYGTAAIPTEELAPLSAVYHAAGTPCSIEPQPLTDEIVAERLSRTE
jgi:Abhydrolase family